MAWHSPLRNLPYRRPSYRGASLGSGDLEVGREFSNKVNFLAALKRYNIKNGVNFHVVKSKSEKFNRKCAVRDNSYSWKIMASVRKKIRLWMNKKLTGVSWDHLKLDSDMIASLILPMVKVDPVTNVSILIANIRSQFNYMPSYRKAWIAKQKALEKMHSG
ncbi:hypothetical protein J1N35_004408 [Gossypium stocksii]|uniref:Transposase MuDR plant domain-containing protein n=1 Tax=Gossypium stocksii TaxID=47602 RepID=A0A9D4AHZ8_9ROSI|nr:hypothetical protein J1N35_004408 [Gossypium stocksii]